MKIIQEDLFERSLEVISQLKTVAIDCETYWTTYSHKRKIIGVSIYGELENRAVSAYFPYRHEFISNGKVSGGYQNLDLGSLKDLAKTLDCCKLHLYHNAKFDRSRFILEGLELVAPFHCTMVMSHMYDENISHELEDLAEMFKIDMEANKRKAHIHDVRKKTMWHAISLDIMGPYACGDTRNTYYLDRKLITLLGKQELLSMWPEEEEYSNALMAMELNGIRINKKLGAKLSEEAENRMLEIEQELGFPPGGQIELAKRLFIELGLPIHERGKPDKRWPTGKPSMGEPILERLKKGISKEDKIANNIIDKVLEFRGLQKAKGTWYDGFREACDNDSRIHANYSQHGTVTTRLSSNTPNMEQIPRDIENTPVKRMLLASDGYELWEFDYSQIEYRFAGVVSGDPIILDAYRSGGDMHQVTADKIGISRQDGKTLNFTLIFLGGPGRVSEVFGLSLNEGRTIWRDYHELYKVMFRFADRVNATAGQRGYIKLWNGRRRRFKFHWEAHKAWNSYVQGGCAQICKYGMLNIYRDKTLHCRINNQVHDSLWIEIMEQLIGAETTLIRHHMEWPSRDSKFKILFPVETKRLA